MICSDCKKNTAVFFVDEKDEKTGKIEKKGYCYSCAKKHGYDPIKNGSGMFHIDGVTDEQIQNMTSQLNAMLKDLTESMTLGENDASEMGDMGDTGENSENGFSTPMGFAIPIGSIFGNNGENNNNDSTQKTKTKVEKKANKKRKFLNSFGTNLTEKARNGKIDKVIGREKEITRIVQILNRRTKNNPCLIGEPGVGKTAIAQGLALKIVEGNVPAKLLNKEIYLLDMTAVVAGTQFRGQFEARMKAIIDECKQDGNVILVIDEIHNIIGAGDAEHTMNAANILKPSLADGSIQIIGTTTLNEYRKYIEKDSALERRFQPVMVEEPTVSDTIDIIKGIKQYYENYHKVTIPDDVIVRLVQMSEKYIHDRFLPDKAIDVLDEACSRINLDNKDLYKLEVLKNKLQEVQANKEEAANADSTDDYKKAAELKMQECSLTDEINAIESKMKPVTLTVEDVAKVIES